MATHCKVLLSDSARLRDIMKAIGILAGRPKRLRRMDESVDITDYTDIECSVEGVRFENCITYPWMVSVYLKPPSLGGAYERQCNYHFESDMGGGRLISALSTPFWVAILDNLIEIFGGKISYSDFNDAWDREVADMGFDFDAIANEAWANKQRALFAIEPLKYLSLVDGRPSSEVARKELDFVEEENEESDFVYEEDEEVSLYDARLRASDEAYENYDFGAPVAAADGWGRTDPGREWNRSVYLESETGGDSKRVGFFVRFKSNESAKVEEVGVETI